MADKEMTEEKVKAEIRAELEELFQAVELKNFLKAKMVSFKGKTKEGGNFSGNLQVEELENDTYHMKISIEEEK